MCSGARPISRRASCAGCSRATASRRWCRRDRRGRSSRWQVDGIGDIRIAVRPEDADEARRLIDSHRIDTTGGRVIPLRNEFAALERRIGYSFRDPGLLEHALTHTSRANEDVSGGVFDNESLEFLGDAVLGFAIADLLFRRFPARDEGWKSKMKAALVSTASLARLAEGLDLGEHLLLGRGEEKTGGRRKQALLADGYEALIAAIYLDGGVEHATAFIARQFEALINEAREPAAAFHDFKSALQERVQSAGDPPPEYVVIGETGPDHHKTVSGGGARGRKAAGGSVGRSKKEAEQEAARLALERLDYLRLKVQISRSLDARQSISMMPHGLRSSSASSLSPPPATTIAGSGCGRRASAYDCTSRATSSSDGHDGRQ